MYSVARIVLNVGYVLWQQCAAETDLEIVLKVRKSLFLDNRGNDFTLYKKVMAIHEMRHM